MKAYFRTIWISDTHLGSPLAHPMELLNFLKSVSCEQLYLVGDIVDIWQLQHKIFWPPECSEVLRRLVKMSRTTKVVYVPGNHDDGLRDFVGERFGQIELLRDTEHTCLDGKKLLITHGDQFDLVVKHLFLVRLGTILYDWLIIANRWTGAVRRRLGMKQWSLSTYVKKRTKQACMYVSNFEEALTNEALSRGFDGVVCGHIHHPEIIQREKLLYMNCGDWMENCSALAETVDGRIILLNADGTERCS